jgi:Stress responsive A/B Barrel Domain
MKTSNACALAASLLISLACGYFLLTPESPAVAADSATTPSAADPQLAHMVYFTLKDRTPEARKKLADLCLKYLIDHPGTVYFSTGILADDMARDVNDRDFDVALHVVFKNKKFHEQYQDAPRHLSFVAEGKPMWAKVRVFDSYVQ